MNLVDEYISKQGITVQPRLNQIREVLRTALPDAEERISYDGLYMFSRFWMETPMKISALRRVILTDEVVRGMAEHCCVE